MAYMVKLKVKERSEKSGNTKETFLLKVECPSVACSIFTSWSSSQSDHGHQIGKRPKFNLCMIYMCGATSSG